MSEEKEKPKRWEAVDAGKEPYSGTSSAAAISAEKDRGPATWWDVIEHPHDHEKGRQT